MSALLHAPLIRTLPSPSEPLRQPGMTNTNDEIVALRAQLAKTEDQLRHANKLASVGTLAASFFHEINNPLGCVFSNFTILQAHVDALLCGLQQRDHSQTFKDPVATSRRLAGLLNESKLAIMRHDLPALMSETSEGVARVRDLLRNLHDFGRLEPNPAWRWFDLRHGINSTLVLAGSLIRERAQLVCNYATLPPVYCVPESLNQVVMNLIINAVQSLGSKRGTITVRTGFDDDVVWFSVADTGAGISAEHLPHIFAPYFTTKPAGKGTGLGLALVEDIVNEHRGHIQVDSQVGEGSIFRVELPLRSNEPHGFEHPRKTSAVSLT